MCQTSTSSSIEYALPKDATPNSSVNQTSTGKKKARASTSESNKYHPQKIKVSSRPILKNDSKDFRFNGIRLLTPHAKDFKVCSLGFEQTTVVISNDRNRVRTVRSNQKNVTKQLNLHISWLEPHSNCMSNAIQVGCKVLLKKS